MTEHDYITPQTCGCTGTSREGRCNICDGGLALCRVCGLTEGCLTTECPGEPSYAEHGDAVYRGERDFAGGRWQEGVCSRHSPAHYGLNRKPA